MEVKSLSRKRIWEIDCVSLDAAVAGSFGWRELVNILQSSGHEFDLQKEEGFLEFQAQCLIHECCHSENPVSLRVENLLNSWHAKTLETLSGWPPSQVAEHVLTTPLIKKNYAGLIWALGSDARQGFDCIRRRFHQRFQIFAVRRLAA